MAYRTSNPALNKKTFQSVPVAATAAERMTLAGTSNKTFLLLLIVVLSAGWTWGHVHLDTDAGFQQATTALVLGALTGLGLVIVTVFKKPWSPQLAPLYAAAEGVTLGVLSMIMQLRYPGIVIQAVMLTFGVLAAMLVLYASGTIQVTDRFRTAVFSATGGILVIYLATITLGFFGIQIPYIHQSGTIGILFSLFVVGVAAANLAVDFDFIESGVAHGAPKYMEWYGAFGLIVTLVWLYLEILRLLGKLRRR
jgi:uncharacterized YccA/Bax inhibitor family protein